MNKKQKKTIELNNYVTSEEGIVLSVPCSEYRDISYTEVQRKVIKLLIKRLKECEQKV